MMDRRQREDLDRYIEREDPYGGDDIYEDEGDDWPPPGICEDCGFPEHEGECEKPEIDEDDMPYHEFFDDEGDK